MRIRLTGLVEPVKRPSALPSVVVSLGTYVSFRFPA